MKLTSQTRSHRFAAESQQTGAPVTNRHQAAAPVRTSRREQLPSSNRRLLCIPCCMGGRRIFLAACAECMPAMLLLCLEQNREKLKQPGNLK